MQQLWWLVVIWQSIQFVSLCPAPPPGKKKQCSYDGQTRWYEVMVVEHDLATFAGGTVYCLY